MKILSLLTGLLLLLCVSTASAFSVTEVIDKTIYDQDMYGMEITLTLDDFSTATYYWGDLGAGISGVDMGDYGSISQYGDTFTAAWKLGAGEQSIVSIKFDAFAGNSVFDIWHEDQNPIYDTGTEGSGWGWYFEILDSNREGISATYSGLVNIEGEAAVGDLYRYMTINFDPSFELGDTLSFRADTDNIPVPEPATLMLFGMGLLGVAGLTRKKML